MTDWMERLGFELRQHDDMVWIVVDDCGGEREATLTERVLWGALMEESGAACSKETALLDKARMLVEVCENTGYPLAEPVAPDLQRAMEQARAERAAAK